MFAISFNLDFWPGGFVRSSLRGGNDTESLLLKFSKRQGGYGILCVVCLTQTQPRYALTKAITRRGAIITVKILDILLIFSMCLQGTGRVARDSLQGRKVAVATLYRYWHESCLIGTMLMRKVWNGSKLSLLAVWNGLQER